MNLITFLQLIRYKNLLMLVFVQCLFSFYFFTDALDYTKLALLVIATTFIAAAGNIINDYFDIKIDRINKPSKVIVGKFISKKKSLFLYSILNTTGIFSGFLLASKVAYLSQGIVFLLLALLLFLYSYRFKGVAILGNSIVSLLIFFSVILIAVFPAIKSGYITKENNSIIIIYAVFSFVFTLLREILKDIEDVDGDYKQGQKTLPILVGRKRTKSVLFYLSILPFFSIILLAAFSKNISLQIYAFIALIIPLGYFMYQIKETKTKKEIHKLSRLLKIIMLLGILSILFLKH